MNLAFARPFALGALGVLSVASYAGAFQEHAESSSHTFDLPYDRTRLTFETVRAQDSPLARDAASIQGWMVQSNRHTGYVHMAYGGQASLGQAIVDESMAVSLAENFVLNRSGVLGTRADNIDLQTVRTPKDKVAVHFQQRIGGVPVYRGTAFVLAARSGQVLAFGSDFYPEDGNVVTVPTLSREAAIQKAVGALNSEVKADTEVSADLVLVPAPSNETMELTVTYQVIFETDRPFGKWESFVHGHTGEILGRRNLMMPVNVIGHVEGDVQAEAPTFGYCDGSATQRLPHLNVNIQGGNTGATDVNGDFDINHGGTNDVTITAQLQGPFIDVNRVTGGSDAGISTSATPGAAAILRFDDANSRQDERDTYFHGNLVHDLIQGIDPTFTQLDVPVACNVGHTSATSSLCPGNAWWNIGAATMNYCNEGGGNANTGELANVIYHEYGHGITDELYRRAGASQPPGDLHEGNSDIVANFLDRNPIIGLGFFLGNCTGGIRNADNTLQFPADNNGGHFGGQIIAGYYWDAWQSLLGAFPSNVADDIIFNNWHYARDTGLPQSQSDQVMWSFLIDDDDANLDNGTPNYPHLCVAAMAHNFSCPTITFGIDITHAPLTTTTDGSALNVVADVVSNGSALDLGTVKVSYRIDGGALTEVVMTPTGTPDEFSAALPNVAGGTVEYFISATNLAAFTANEPLNAPSSFFEFDVATIHDPLETGGTGWTAGIPSDDASTGAWELIDPNGTSAQPEDDAGAGSFAFITGQCGNNQGTCGAACAASLGCNDVDGGTTTLLSPVYSMGGASGVLLRYDRWYSNDQGASPGNDSWVVDISNDGGSSWTSVENTMASSANWTTITVDVDAVFGVANDLQLRFIASDLGDGSIVEAGVDELRIIVPGDPSTDAPELASGTPLTAELSQNQPNPFHPRTQIQFAVPTAGNVDLAVFNVQGQKVRNLATGNRPAGRYTVTWDGRDVDGQRVSAGVYFYRLTTAQSTLTRKMTVLQ